MAWRSGPLPTDDEDEEEDMPRVTTVKKARKDQGTCGSCRKDIKAGDGYRWWKFRYGGKRIRCMDSKCAPRASDLTQSEYYATMYGIQEGFHDQVDAIDNWDDLESLRDDIASQAQDTADEQEEKHSNMPESLQDSDTGNLLEERRDACEGWVSELEDWDVSEWKDQQPDADTDTEDDGTDEKVDADLLQQAKDALGEVVENVDIS